CERQTWCTRLSFRARREPASRFRAGEVDQRCAGACRRLVNTNISASGNGRSSSPQPRSPAEKTVRTPWPDKNGALIEEFLRSFHAPSKRARYASALNDLQKFVKKRSLNQSTLRAWLRTCAAKYGKYRIILSGRIADRFLDWLVTRELVRVNPFARLRRKYE